MILKELEQLNTWLLWKKENRKGRVAKIPFSVKDKPCGTDEKYQTEWVTYQEALNAVKVQSMDGVGFRIPKGFFFPGH